MIEQWRVFGQLPCRASDQDLMMWVRAMPAPASAHYQLSRLGLGWFWTEVLEEIEFRNLLPINEWMTWSKYASH